jgi:DNA polymerase-4
MGTTSEIYRSRKVLHMDMDTFFVSVERLLDPKLNKKPVIVGGTPFERGVVAGCSYETRAFGVHSAMPLRQAYRLCPSAVFLRGNYTHYGEYSRLVSEILADLAPEIEKSSVDEFYLDLSGTERLKGNTFTWAQEIQKTISGETQLPLSFGLASNKLVAKVATTQRGKLIEPKGYEVISGDESSFLAPFPIRALPSIGEVTEQTLLTYGMHKIGQIAQTPIQLLQRLFGKTGKRLFDYANGVDLSPVLPTREQKSISRESTFSEDTFEPGLVTSTLHKLCSDLSEELRSNAVLAGKIVLKLRYSDFHTLTKSHGVSYTNVTQDIYAVAESLLRKVWTRRIRVRLIGVEANDLIDDLKQLYLFGGEKKESKIDTVVDSLNQKYGNRSIIYASHLIS